MEKLQSQRLQIHSFIAAFIGGYFIWGNYNKVNEQVSRTQECRPPSIWTATFIRLGGNFFSTSIKALFCFEIKMHTEILT